MNQSDSSVTEERTFTVLLLHRCSILVAEKIPASPSAGIFSFLFVFLGTRNPIGITHNTAIICSICVLGKNCCVNKCWLYLCAFFLSHDERQAHHRHNCCASQARSANPQEYSRSKFREKNMQRACRTHPKSNNSTTHKNIASKKHLVLHNQIKDTNRRNIETLLNRLFL